MAKRVVDPSKLQGLVQASQNQEIIKGNPRSTDPNFPVFGTPTGEDIIVYIPRVNLKVGENGETMDLLTSYIHDGRIGKRFTSLRCINGLHGNPLYDELGYDGSCPACEAIVDVWELYNIKMANEAKRMGINIQEDTTDALKTVRETFLREMDLKGAEEYVTFPIVIIPQKAKFIPTDTAAKDMEVQFVHWRKKRYDDKILGALESMLNNPGHPAGQFMFWKFTYDTQGKQAEAMHAAKNAKYSVLTDAEILKNLEPLRASAEEKAKDFTNVKAVEVIVANQFMYLDDIKVEVDKILQKTRSTLELHRQGQTPQIGTGGVAPQIGMGNPLESFGQAPQTADGQQAPQNLGVSGSPVNFG